jgi:glycosyltransferase involved in cell wall biosynthesis
MRIGVVPNLDRALGGTYQYSVTMLTALRHPDPDDEIVVFLYAGETLPAELVDAEFRVVYLTPDRGFLGSMWQTVARWLPSGLYVRMRQLLGSGVARASLGAGGSADDNAPIDPAWAGLFAHAGAELLIFTSDSDVAFQSGVPYIAAIHDLQYLLQPEFPELSLGDEFDRRDYTMRNTVVHATGLLVDSQVGKEDVFRLFGDSCEIDPESVFVLPFLPADYLLSGVTDADRSRVAARYGISPGYLFYPAQFWPHKNHARVVAALGELHRHGLSVELVLAGSKPAPLGERTFTKMMVAAEREGVEGMVHYLGYVPDEDMPGLYSQAAALIMPTFFGPTNIPVVEAWSLGCPVITSDIRGVREQTRDAAVLVDPCSVTSIAEGIRRVVEDPKFSKELSRRGYARLATYTRDDYARCLLAAIRECKRRVSGASGDLGGGSGR